ncbi:membrane-associated protein, putative [Bodo saltans]|uniref:Membrane-associated protein, putative n=1 Tax=Bodo saltans TaxID=75058 RepID=A0A0S4J9D0_BODSA|nr:membrane-associated protein, putative [Bodo saltans]|eukprot:CUG84707.1 membrane-associated protein, putative [Bodo saltans]
MPTPGDYYRSMTRKDQADFVVAAGVTLCIGVVLLFFLFRWLNGRVNPPKGPIIPRRTVTIEPSRKVESDEATKQSQPKERRHIPKAAQASIVERGTRLLAENKVEEALACFLALLFSSVESEDKVLPTQLTECLRGVGQCYMALGKSELGVRFLQAERRVFEEMVVMAARPPGSGGSIPHRSIIASLLSKKGSETMPKRCYTLGEVADACTKLGHHDIALAYRVKAAALRQRVSGEPLDPESEEAAILAQSLNAFQTAKSESSLKSDLHNDFSSARTQLQSDVLHQVEQLQGSSTDNSVAAS